MSYRKKDFNTKEFAIIFMMFLLVLFMFLTPLIVTFSYLAEKQRHRAEVSETMREIERDNTLKAAAFLKERKCEESQSVKELDSCYARAFELAGIQSPALEDNVRLYVAVNKTELYYNLRMKEFKEKEALLSK